LTCEEVRELHQAYAAGELAAEEKSAFEAHCRECEACRQLLEQMEVPTPPPYLAAEIKEEALQRTSPERTATRKRAIGSPQFLAACAVIAAGVIVALIAADHMNNSEAREDAWAPAIIVTSGGATVDLTDTEDPMRVQSRDEILEKLQRHGHVAPATDTSGEEGTPQPGASEVEPDVPPAEQ